VELTIIQLKSLWNKEKENYQSQEVGSGVQKFVKDVLECGELFNLKEGKISTPNEKRKDEFICEYKTKSKRRVDVAIFITPEILIPVEVEQYTNIQAGINQLFQYQIDLDRKYGILTDGYTWRFFNNNIYRTFTLKEIFDETKTFLEFWKEYIKPEHYYLSFFETFGQLSLFKDVEKMNVENNRQIFFEDITKLIRSIKEKLNVEGYFNGLDKKAKEKKATEITYAYIIQFILYKALVDNAFQNFGKEYLEYVKKTHECLKNKQYKNILSIIDNISAKISENIYRPFLEEQKYISKKIQQLYRKVENQLSDVSLWLDIFVFIKKYRFENVKNEIFGFIYENYLKELYEDEKKGQYFTDPAVVNFMLQQIGYTEKEIKGKIENDQSDKLSIIDPSCGSGTFLYSAVDQIMQSFSSATKDASEKIEEVVTKNVFGLDIEEFPLYLAEMNIIMRMLPYIISEKYNNPVDKKIKVFLTNDSIAEFVSTPIDNTEVDEYVRVKNGGNGVADAQMIFPGLAIQEPEFDSFMRVSEDIKEMKESLKNNRIPRRRFDYVIANPPYVGYNECSKQEILIFKMLQGKVKPKVNLNNIYGINLHSIPDNRKKRPPKPNLYAFFVAVGLALLKDNGKLCYIIPQNILTTGDYDVLRYHLANFTTIEKIITFNRNLFISRGVNQKKVISTSSLIFVVSKKPPTNTHGVDIINYRNGEDTIEDTLANILAGKKIDKKKVLQTDLLKNVANWSFIKQGTFLIKFQNEYQKNSTDISIYYDHDQAMQKFNSKFFFDIGYYINERKVLQSPSNKDLHYQYPKLNRKFLTVVEYKGYWPNIRTGNSQMTIKLLKNNQEYNLLDSKYKIIWSYANPSHFHFSDKPIIWARNQICAIGSENKKEILYLFSILDSEITNKILISNLKTETEKDFLVSTSSVKEYVRVPKITKENQFIKDEIIKRTEEMLSLEEKTLSDIVDFSGIMLQKFDDIEIDGSNLYLKHNGNKIKLKIKSDVKLISETIQKELKEELKLENKKINLADLKNLPVIDFDKQKKLKDYIDDLVLALYFNVPVNEIGPSKSDGIKNLCSKNKYYQIVNNL